MAKKEPLLFIGRSEKISKDNKETIVDLMAIKAVQKETDKIEKRLTAFADKIYEDLIRPYVMHLKALPNYMVVRSKYLNIRIKNGLGYNYQFELSKESIVTYSNQNNYRYDTPHLNIENYPKEVKCLEKIEQDREILAEKKRGIRGAIYSAYRQINSTKQLFKHWPEAYKVYVVKFPPKPVMDIVIPRTDLNEMLKLEEVE